ncbi:MAG TPA: BREX system P-loop protein BrxC [Armatimonadetes bacterium]|nr:BREX system P-loop protein BrxC [Armatimonadota bacterium]
MPGTQPSDNRVGSLFRHDINRQIEEVIKVDQTDEQVLASELGEYVVTAAIRDHFVRLLDRYLETPQKPHEAIAVWISGFFGSGKSSFAKILGLALANRTVGDSTASQLLAQRTDDPRLRQLLSLTAENIPTEAVIFDIASHHNVVNPDQKVTEILYRVFLEQLGYPSDLDLAELEITLEQNGQLARFEEAYARTYSPSTWADDKSLTAVALSRASAVMYALDPGTYATQDSWLQAVQGRAAISPDRLATRIKELMERRRPGRAAVLVIDEVGQFIASDLQKMLDLQAIVEDLGRIGKGRFWLVVTAQERLNEVVSGIDSTKLELPKIMDRFSTQIHLDPSDIAEVTSRRVLAKNPEAQTTLRELYEEFRARLDANTRLIGRASAPALDADSFIKYYPLLPYHIGLLIDVVSGLRTQAGPNKHLGGANRTIIKLTQQLLIHTDSDLANQPVGTLATLDLMYDRLVGNIPDDIVTKINGIPAYVDHRLAQPVAKAICLLNYAGEDVPCNAENIAAVLHPAVDADSQLQPVREALAALTDELQIRDVQGRYHIPSPAEDSWEQQRQNHSPKPSDLHRVQAKIIHGLWATPKHTLHETKDFTAGLTINGRDAIKGDVVVHMTLAETAAQVDELIAEAKTRSQTETDAIFWVAELDQAVSNHLVEYCRSEEMLQQEDNSGAGGLTAQEKARLSRHEDELKRLLRERIAAGRVFFGGYDRRPDEQHREVRAAVSDVLSQCLPTLYPRYREAAKRVSAADLQRLLHEDNLDGLPRVFRELNLLQSEGGTTTFRCDSGPLEAVLSHVGNRQEYNDIVSGRALTDHFEQPPYGWPFDTVRLFAACLLRAGRLEATSQSHPITDATSIEARDSLPHNNKFRAMSFRVRDTLEHADVIRAATMYREVFGQHLDEVVEDPVAAAIRTAVDQLARTVRAVLGTLREHRLPGAAELEGALKSAETIGAGDNKTVIKTFIASADTLAAARKRSLDLQKTLDPDRLGRLGHARAVLDVRARQLLAEPDLDPALKTAADDLRGYLTSDLFFDELATIDTLTTRLDSEYSRRHTSASTQVAAVYKTALERLTTDPDWAAVEPEQQARIAQPLHARTSAPPSDEVSLGELRAAADACPTLRDQAITQLRQLVVGDQLVTLEPARFATTSIDSLADLEAALQALRAECQRLLDEGKTISWR